METTTTFKELVPLTQESITNAISKIREFATKRKLVFDGSFTLNLPTNFPSNKKKKEFHNVLDRVLFKTTMRTSNVFLHKLAKYNETAICKLEYSDKEKEIKNAKAKLNESIKVAIELRKTYNEVKGDFYKSL